MSRAYEVDFHTCDGMFIKQIRVPKSGTLIPQHSHKWDHSTLLAAGSVVLWSPDESGVRRPKLFRAPAVIFIPAKQWHEFQIMEDDTVLYCLHNLKGEEVVQVLQEHQLEEADVEV